MLEIEFNSGDIWQYDDVPEIKYEALMAAESKGRYFLKEIRGHYHGEKVK